MRHDVVLTPAGRGRTRRSRILRRLVATLAEVTFSQSRPTSACGSSNAAAVAVRPGRGDATRTPHVAQAGLPAVPGVVASVKSARNRAPTRHSRVAFPIAQCGHRGTEQPPGARSRRRRRLRAAIALPAAGRRTLASLPGEPGNGRLLDCCGQRTAPPVAARTCATSAVLRRRQRSWRNRRRASCRQRSANRSRVVTEDGAEEEHAPARALNRRRSRGSVPPHQVCTPSRACALVNFLGGRSP